MRAVTQEPARGATRPAKIVADSGSVVDPVHSGAPDPPRQVLVAGVVRDTRKKVKGSAVPAMKVTVSAAMRARDVSRPRPEHLAEAEAAEASAPKGAWGNEPGEPSGEGPAEAGASDAGVGWARMGLDTERVGLEKCALPISRQPRPGRRRGHGGTSRASHRGRGRPRRGRARRGRAGR